ncbi:MAG: glutamine-hydrolyzing GMP synthase, partial [Clostridia bacterium]|nr:glutamine-hydrolyzing GMP synthase [Clostridia bacterium]
FEVGNAVLGICYGMQLMAHVLGGKVVRMEQQEYGPVAVTPKDGNKGLLQGLQRDNQCWMSHIWQVSELPEGFEATARTKSCPVAAMQSEGKGLYGVQFHPEVACTREGYSILDFFLKDVCGLAGDWNMEVFKDMAVRQIAEQVRDGERVLMDLGGGVDSAVTAALIYRAIGDRLTCISVDHGLMRKGEGDLLTEVFARAFPVRLVHVDASERFFADLRGIVDTETKRKIIGRDFAEVFKEEACRLGKFDHFAQGTIWPDAIGSGMAYSGALTKSHHNVGGLPAELGFTSLVEPLAILLQEEVRKLGLILGLPDSLVTRRPFPGPGMAVRCLGELTRDKVSIVRETDAILLGEIASAGLEGLISQYYTVLTEARSAGVTEDGRTYAYVVAIRTVLTDDLLAADIARLPDELLERVAARITGEVPGVNRVLYDAAAKPPAQS